MGALCSTEIFDGNAALFLLIFFFFEWACLEAICEWLQSD